MKLFHINAPAPHLDTTLTREKVFLWKQNAGCATQHKVTLNIKKHKFSINLSYEVCLTILHVTYIFITVCLDKSQSSNVAGIATMSFLQQL